VSSSQSCTYNSNGRTLTLSNMPYLSWFDGNSLSFYYWTPCTNGYSCTEYGLSVNVMAGELNLENSYCNKLAMWDPTVPAIYTPNNQTWKLTFNNGRTCGLMSLPITTIFYLRCGTGFNQITSVTNPSGTCTYSYYATGPGFCSYTTTSTSSTTSTKSSTTTSTTVIPSTTTTTRHGSHGNSISGRLLLIIIILSLIVVILCCVLCIVICFGLIKCATGFDKKEALISLSLSQSNQNQNQIKNERIGTEEKSTDQTVDNIIVTQ